MIVNIFVEVDIDFEVELRVCCYIFKESDEHLQGAYTIEFEWIEIVNEKKYTPEQIEQINKFIENDDTQIIDRCYDQRD